MTALHMPDGKPDLSGVWENGPLGFEPPGRRPAAAPDQPPEATFFDIGSGFKGGLPLRRPQPTNDPQPWWYGYSTGKWDGDTLVVETTGLRDGGWLDIWGSPLTDAAKITERFRRPNDGSLPVDVTIDDSKAYTKPFTVRFNQHLTPGAELIEFICAENEQSASHLLGRNGPSSDAGVSLTPQTLDRYVGRYQLAPGAFVTILREGSRMFGRSRDNLRSSCLPPASGSACSWCSTHESPSTAGVARLR